MSSSRTSPGARPGLFTGLCLVLLLVAGFSAPAQAYNTLKHYYNGGEVEWSASNTPVPWSMHPSGSADVSFDAAQGAIKKAFDAWTAVSCSTISFNYTGTNSYQPSVGIWIRFQTGYWDPSVDGAAAYSTTTEYGSGNTIKKNEIVFNDAELDWSANPVGPYSTLQDIQGVVTHEIGHSIGLDHSKIREATMFFSGGSSELASLDADDQRGACYLYSSGSFTSGEVCDSCTSDSHCAAGDCIGYPDNQSYCGSACTNDNQCPEDYFCYTDSGINQCASFNVRCDQGGSNVPLGQYCWGAEVCESSVCLPLPNDAYCSQECNPSYDNCPSGFSCLGEGSEGYCIQAGAVPYGGSCATHIECTTSMCAQVCANTAICVQDCSDGQACPGGGPCQQGMCIPAGSTPYGGSCSCATECQTSFCTGAFGGNFCSMECSNDEQCPGAYCTSNGYCGKPGGGAGTECQQDSNCEASMWCKYESPSKPSGTCVLQCDPVYDSGCAAGQVCLWRYMGWLDRVEGECVVANGGVAELQACDPSSAPCEAHLICADAGKGLRCYSDCKTTSAVGCDYTENCIGMGNPSDPKHGLCVPTDAPPPDTIDPPVDTVQPEVVEPDVAPPVDVVSPDTTTPPVDTTNPTPDTTQPTPDTAQPSQDTGSNGGGNNGGFQRDDGGSCQMSPRAPAGRGATAGAVLLFLFSLSLLAVSRRRGDQLQKLR